MQNWARVGHRTQWMTEVWLTPALLWSRWRQTWTYIYLVLGDSAHHKYIDSSEGTCSLCFPLGSAHKILRSRFCPEEDKKNGFEFWVLQEKEPSLLSRFSLFSLEVPLLKSSCLKSPRRRQSLWKAAQPRLTNYSSASPLKEANVIIPFAKRECEHICSSTHPLGTPSPCKLPQLTLCHSSTACV